MDLSQQKYRGLLQKQGISDIEQYDRQRGFYSVYFLVSKKMGDFRPTLNLCHLNICMHCMLTIKQLLGLVQ